MVTKAIQVTLQAKSGKETELEEFLISAQPLALAETDTISWYVVKHDQSTFGIFDTFNDEAGRRAHLNGQIAAALMQKADELLSSPPDIKQIDVLSAK